MLLHIHLLEIRTIVRSGSTIFFMRGTGSAGISPSLPLRQFDSSEWIAIHSDLLSLSQVANILEFRVDGQYKMDDLRVEAVEFV